MLLVPSPFTRYVTNCPYQLGPALTSLTLLDLHANRLTEWPAEMCEMVSLRSLKLSRNKLSALPKQVGCFCPVLASLRRIVAPLPFPNNASGDTRYAPFPLFLPVAAAASTAAKIERLSALESLDLRHNALPKLPRSLGRLVQLVSLSLGHNALSELPHSLRRLRKLRGRVDLSHNQFRQLPAVVRSCSV